MIFTTNLPYYLSIHNYRRKLCICPVNSSEKLLLVMNVFNNLIKLLLCTLFDNTSRLYIKLFFRIHIKERQSQRGDFPHGHNVSTI